MENLNWFTIVAIILGIYEVIIRFVPTVTSWSILKLVIDFLGWISEHLDRKKTGK